MDSDQTQLVPDPVKHRRQLLFASFFIAAAFGATYFIGLCLGKSLGIRIGETGCTTKVEGAFVDP